MTTLLERIETDLRAALKDRAEIRLSALRLLKADLQYEMNKSGASQLPDKTVVQLIRRSVKKRGEAIEQYERAGRQELAAKERAEMEQLSAYLPPTVGTEDINRAVEQACERLQPKPQDVGKVIGAVMQNFQDSNIDGALVRELVLKKLKN